MATQYLHHGAVINVWPPNIGHACEQTYQLADHQKTLHSMCLSSWTLEAGHFTGTYILVEQKIVGATQQHNIAS